jgi:hypothetical protein
MRIMFRCVFSKWNGEGIELAQDRNRWEALENAVMKFGFHKMREI